MRVTFITVASNAYWMGFAALVESIHANSGLNLDQYSFLAYSSAPIPEYVKEWAAARQEHIRFRVGQELDDWTCQAPQNLERLHESFKKIGLFGIEKQGTERHVFIDADIICLNSLRDIFDYSPFAGVPYISDHKCYRKLRPGSEVDHINGGFFIFEPSAKDRDDLIKLYEECPEKYTRFADQDLLAEWIARSKAVNFMPQIWNCLKGIVIPMTGKLDKPLLKRIKLLHFTGTNPWDSPKDIRLSEGRFLEIELLWWRYYKNSGMKPPEKYKYPTGSSHAYKRWTMARVNFVRNRLRRLSVK